MRKKYHFKTSCLRICAWLITLLILHPLNLFAEQGQGNIDRILKVKGDRISITAPDPEAMKVLQSAKLVDVLKKIEADTGVKITLSNELAGKKLTASFADETIESAMRQLLRGHYYVMHYAQDSGNKDMQILKEVRIGPELGSIAIKGKVTSIEIPYGSGKGEIGIIIGSEGASQGPKSFAVDGAGNIYICDTVNERIQKFSPEGTYLSVISLKDEARNREKGKRIYTHVLEDITVDSSGLIYIYDSFIGKIYQSDSQGNIIGSMNTEGGTPLEIMNDALYGGGRLIAKISSDGKLGKPTDSELKENKEDVKKGMHGLSGRRYKGKNYGDGVNTEMTVTGKDGRKALIVSYPPRKDITHGPTLGEDEQGNFYSINSLHEDKFQMFNIDKFNSDEEYVGTAKIPGGNHYFWAVREFLLTPPDGNVYNYIPEEKKLKIFIFREDK